MSGPTVDHRSDDRDRELDDVLVAGAVASLARLPEVGSVRLRSILRHHHPVEALDLLATGRPLHHMAVGSIPAAQLMAIRRAARESDVQADADHLRATGIRVTWVGQPDYPAVLAADLEAPTAIFAAGSFDAIDARRVGIVGTRNATAAGLATARELGAALADRGVTVVSGLALGIDGAAHTGVRASTGPGRPIAVVGSGPDVVYPRRHRQLWEWVPTAGLLLSEWPPGTPPDAWRFPARNRIIAALSEVLVVVESRERGGSLITAQLALDRDVQVMAVPGSPRVRAAMGTNKLLVDGAAPVTCVDDVLVMLGLDTRRRGGSAFDPRPPPTDDQLAVLDACESEPCTLDAIAAATGLSLTDAALAAARLERGGWLVEVAGWFEPTASRLAERTERWIPPEAIQR